VEAGTHQKLIQITGNSPLGLCLRSKSHCKRECLLCDSSMATPVNLTIEHQDSSRTGLVSSFGGHQRSYGTVKEHTGPTYRTRHSSLLQHEVQEGDTFAGLALKYSVTVRLRAKHLLKEVSGVLFMFVIKYLDGGVPKCPLLMTEGGCILWATSQPRHRPMSKNSLLYA